MAKKKNRKKEYLLKLKRAGIIKAAAKVATNVVSKATLSLEEFSAISAVEGIRQNLLKHFIMKGLNQFPISKTLLKKTFWPLKELVQQLLIN